MDIIKLTEEHAALTAEKATLTEQLATAQAAFNKADASAKLANEELEASESANTDLRSQVTKATAEAEASAKEKADLLAQIETLKASQADFDKALGAKVLEVTGKGGNKAVEGQHEGGGKKEITRAEFKALSAKEQSTFALSGGKITE